jgi:hypothetical protein
LAFVQTNMVKKRIFFRIVTRKTAKVKQSEHLIL